jgi:hypothetical protein
VGYVNGSHAPAEIREPAACLLWSCAGGQKLLQVGCQPGILIQQLLWSFGSRLV